MDESGTKKMLEPQKGINVQDSDHAESGHTLQVVQFYIGCYTVVV